MKCKDHICGILTEKAKKDETPLNFFACSAKVSDNATPYIVQIFTSYYWKYSKWSGIALLKTCCNSLYFRTIVFLTCDLLIDMLLFLKYDVLYNQLCFLLWLSLYVRLCMGVFVFECVCLCLRFHSTLVAERGCGRNRNISSIAFCNWQCDTGPPKFTYCEPFVAMRDHQGF